MKKFDVQIALEGVAEAKAKWSAAQREFQQGLDTVMSLLLHEAARNYMSPAEVAKMCGMTRVQVVNKMKAVGLHPHDGKRLLSEKAAKALNENAELLGIKPHEMDLLSPLAYLPMGDTLRKELQAKTAPAVTEFPETDDIGTPLQMAEKLADAGVLLEDAIEWVNEVITRGEPIR